MPEYLAPGVYVEETSFRSRSIEGVGTSTTAFVGPTLFGPVDGTPELLTSAADFERIYGGLDDLASGGGSAQVNCNYVAHAVRAYFENGGRRLYVVRVLADASADYERALGIVQDLEDVSIVAAPGYSSRDDRTAQAIQDALIGHAEQPRACRIAVLDAPAGKTPAEMRELRGKVDCKRVALYYPWVVVDNPLARPGGTAPWEITLPPSGFVAGIYARTDMERGVWKAPANEVVRGALRLERDVSAAEQELLNPIGVNCLRYLPGRGCRVWGARTLSSDPDWKYVNVRRYFNYLEASIDRGTQWAVFEPNGETLWQNVRATISDFLLNEWKRGALLGTRVEEAFFVHCDRTTMTQNDLDHGRLICLIGVAVVRPAEFMIFRIGQKTADAW